MKTPRPTRRLAYRGLDSADVEAVHTIWSDPQVMRYLPGDPSASLADTTERLERHATRFRETGYGLCAVEERGSGDVVGVCGLFPVEWVGPDVEVAYHFAQAVWNRGYATEAAGAWIAAAFAEPGLERVVALAFPANSASTRVMEKVGMRFERQVQRYGVTLVEYAIERQG
jgi:[ribosomal protein S5]-alanine N-acetyltransferase